MINLIETESGHRCCTLEPLGMPTWVQSRTRSNTPADLVAGRLKALVFCMWWWTWASSALTLLYNAKISINFAEDADRGWLIMNIVSVLEETSSVHTWDAMFFWVMMNLRIKSARMSLYAANIPVRWCILPRIELDSDWSYPWTRPKCTVASRLEFISDLLSDDGHEPTSLYTTYILASRWILPTIQIGVDLMFC